MKACAALKTTCWKPAEPLRVWNGLGRFWKPVNVVPEILSLCWWHYRLALEHCSLLGQKEMVGVPLEMCLVPVRVSAGTLAQSFLTAKMQMELYSNALHKYICLLYYSRSKTLYSQRETNHYSVVCVSIYYIYLYIDVYVAIHTLCYTQRLWITHRWHAWLP